MLNVNLNLNVSRRGGVKIPAATVGRYTTETTTVGSETYLVDQSDNGNDLLIVAGGVVDGKLTPDTVLRMPSAYWDKSDTSTWVTGNFFYYDAGNPRDWRVDELHYRLIDEVFGVNPTHRTFGRQVWADEVFTGLDRLVLYDSEQTQLATLRSFIGIKDFQNQGNYYYSGEWTIRPYLQFIVEGTTFDLDLQSSSTDTLYWGDGTSDTITTNANYAHTWAYGGKHLISVTDGLTRFDISSRGLTFDMTYWFYFLKKWTSISYFRLYNNLITGNMTMFYEVFPFWSNLQHLRIGSNLLSGVTTNWYLGLPYLTKLQYLYIDTNKLTGNHLMWDNAGKHLTNIRSFRTYNNELEGIYAPAQLSLNDALMLNNDGSLESVNTLLKDWYDFYSDNAPIRDVTLDISGGTNAAPTYDYQPLLDLFTDAGHLLSVTTN